MIQSELFGDCTLPDLVLSYTQRTLRSSDYFTHGEFRRSNKQWFQTNFVSEDAVIFYKKEMLSKSRLGKFVSVVCFMQFLLRKQAVKTGAFIFFKVATAKKNKLNQKHNTFFPFLIFDCHSPS